MKMTNRWNQFIYRLWGPIYDSTVSHFFMPGCKCAMDLLNLQFGKHVSLVGGGTDINRRLSDMMKNCPCKITHDEPSIDGEMYRVILLKKN